MIVQETALVERSSTVVWTTKEWESYSPRRKLFLRIARDPVSRFSSFQISRIFCDGKLVPHCEYILPSSIAACGTTAGFDPRKVAAADSVQFTMHPEHTLSCTNSSVLQCVRVSNSVTKYFYRDE